MQHRNATVGEHDNNILFLWGLSVMVTILVSDCNIILMLVQMVHATAE